MSASKTFLYFCLFFIGGIFLSSIFSFSVILLLGLTILGLILISAFFKYKKLVIAGFCFLFLVLGIWRYQTAEIQSSKVKMQNYDGGKITLIGVVIDEPTVGEKSQKLTVKIEEEKILITAGRYPEYRYGDKLQITGKLESPPVDINGVKEDKSSSSPFAVAREFNYQDYLKKDGIYSVMVFPQIELLGHNFGNPLMKTLFSVKDKFKQSTSQFIPLPQQGFLEALIFGDENNLSASWKEKLNLTGTRHIAAVSGMNITIISALLLSFLLSLGLWRQQAFYLAVFLLVLYILMIGAPASGVRAGVMGILFLTAQHFGRASSAYRLVIFAAVFMLALNPLLLRLDIGFQLSFLAILGIVHLQPLLVNLLKKVPDLKFFPLKSTLATTLSAQIFTFPILIYNFGYFSFLSSLTNFLIVPILGPLTILIFIFGVAAMTIPPLGYIISLPVWLSLTYLTSVINFFSKLSFGFLAISRINWPWLAVFYLILFLAINWFGQKQKLKIIRI